MAPKTKGGAAATESRHLPPSILDDLFPPWNDAAVAAETASGGRFEDETGLILPPAVEPFLDTWKRSEDLVLNRPNVPILELQTTSVDGVQKLGGQSGREFSGELFAGHSVFDWMLAVFRAVVGAQMQISPGGYLWELIYPKEKDGSPMKTSSGKYIVKLYIMDQWRQVTVDDRIPVDLFGRPLPVGIRPIQLWPLILSKAIIKMMAAYKLISAGAPDEVPAFQWLTGWPQEDISHSISGVAVDGGFRFDRLEQVFRESNRKEERSAVAVCCLKRHAAPERPLPRLIVFCGPSGVGKGRLMDLLVETFPDEFARTISNTTRRPLEHEEHGQHYFFTTRAEMARDIEENKFLETAEVVTTRGSNSYGTSLATVREVAATGKLCVMGMDLQGVKALQANQRVDGLYIYVNAPSLQQLEIRQRGRRTEAKSTVQKRLQWARDEMDRASENGHFDHIIETNDIETVYMDIKEAISSLSPIIRNRLRGLPAYVLDYSDLIPSNSVEKPFLKPVLICGPTTGEKSELVGRLVSEFPDVFGLPRMHTTAKVDEDNFNTDHTRRASELMSFACGDGTDEQIPIRPDSIVLSKEEFQEYVEKGRFAEHHADMFVHRMVQDKHGVTPEDIQEVLGQGKLCLMECESEAADMLRAQGVDHMTIFLTPPSMEIFENRLDKWLKYPDKVIQRMMNNAKREAQLVAESGIMDYELVNDDIRDALDELKGAISKFRPDIIPPKEEDPERHNRAQPSLFLSGPLPEITERLKRRLASTLPDTTAVPIMHTSRPPEKGDQEGLEYYFLKPDALESMRENGDFIFVKEDESAGFLCGVTWEEIQRIGLEGRMAIVRCPVEAVQNVRDNRLAGSLCVFVAPPSIEDIESEILAANSESPEDDVRILIGEAKEQMDQSAKPGLFDYLILEDDEEIQYADLQDSIAEHSPKVAPLSHKPLVVAGPFGTGKRHILQRLFDEYEYEFVTPVVTTTREIHDSSITEDDAVGYTTDTKENFARNVDKGKFLVHNEVLGTSYGIRKAHVRKLQAIGKVCVIDLDKVEDVVQLKEEGFVANYVFVGPDTIDNMYEHFRKEILSNPPLGYEPEGALDLLFLTAKAEVDAAKESGAFDFMVRNGPDVDASYCELAEAISVSYPKVLPASNVWGFGRPLWDASCRVYGHRPLKVAVMGPAASGKTTLCEEIVLHFGIPHINVGELLYAEVQGKTALGLEAKKYMDASKTVPDEIFLEVVTTRLRVQECDVKGWLLDGFPHTKSQAEKLAQRGIIPDKVIFLEAEHSLLLDRVKHRLVDPVTGKVYHIPEKGSKSLSETITPLTETGTLDEEVMSRLTVRHDDLEDNVRNRLKFYDAHYPGLKTVFADVSFTLFGQGCREDIFTAAGGFISVEHVHGSDIRIVPSTSLKDAEYEVVGVLKYRRRSLVSLYQADGKTFWVAMAELATNTKCLLLYRNPSAFSFSGKIDRSNMLDFKKQTLLFAESEEPIHILSALFMGVQFPLECPRSEQPPLLIITGPPCAGKGILVDMICSDFPDKVTAIRRVTTQRKVNGSSGEFEHTDSTSFDVMSRTEQFAFKYSLDEDSFGIKQEDLKNAVNSGKLCLLELDTAGMAAINETDFDAKTVFVSSTIESLDRRMRTRKGWEEQAIQHQIRRALSDLDLVANNAMSFDHIIKNEDLGASFARFKDIVARYWLKPKAPSSCNMLVEFQEWGSGNPGRTCRRLNAVASSATAIELPRGRHLLRIHTDQEVLHTSNFWSNAPFEVADAQEVLRAKENLFVERSEGQYPSIGDGAWGVLLWYTFSVGDVCKMALEIQINDEKYQRFVQLFIIDNDTGAESSHLLCRTNPTTYVPNKHGYSVVAVMRSQECTQIPEGWWQATFISDKELKYEQQVTNRMEEFDGDYRPNSRCILSRHKLTPSTRTQFAIRAQTLPPLPFVLSIVAPPEGQNTLEWRGEETSAFCRPAHGSAWVPAISLDAGFYIVQMQLDASRCPFNIDGMGKIDPEVKWRLEIVPTKDEKECPVGADDCLERFLQDALNNWNELGKGGAKDRPKNAALSLTRYMEDRDSQTSPAPQTREIAKGEFLELDPETHVRFQSTQTSVTDDPATDCGDGIARELNVEDSINQHKERIEQQLAEETAREEHIAERLSEFRTLRQEALVRRSSITEKFRATLSRPEDSTDKVAIG